MNTNASGQEQIVPGPIPLQLSVARRVNEVCEQFEAAWRAGDRPRPRIEEVLGDVPEHARLALLVELLPLELELRRDAGDDPRLSEYLGRFPGSAEAEVVAAAFAGLNTGSLPDGTTIAGKDSNATAAWVPSTQNGGPRPRDHFPDMGDYELLGELARGGMGVIFRARQRSLNRIVALKMILSGQFASPEERRRFLLEAELAANLDHPNIVPIYEVGEHDGRHYFSMKLVEGGSLCREVPRLLNDPRASARLLATVARAVHYAHRRGFVHCDLKPSNILIDAEGCPHVTDFGLARRVDGDSTLTASYALLGTPSYMAPEQATGDRKALTPLTDVYALGAILYELLTGHPPFRSPSVMETVVQVLEREPPPPRQVRPGVPPALEAICLKCLDKSPEARYVSAAELAETLEQYLRGEPVVGTTLSARFRRWTRREPELFVRLVGLLVMMLLTQYNYQWTPSPKFAIHYRVQAVFVLWAVASFLYQTFLRRGCWAELARYLWAATDMTALTIVLIVLKAMETNLVVGYPLLIAASGLWFRIPIVWFTTALAVAGYAVLYLFTNLLNPGWEVRQYPNIFLASLIVTGLVISRQLNRTLSLSAYYEQRPVA